MIRKIYHVSDVHLRNFKRHEEYKLVFENLYDYIKNTITEEDLIVLTGDIVHSKTDVTPELYDEVQLFIKTLCQFGRVLLIPGNHDANLANSNRLDALTPIVNALNEPNLIYSKDTEVIDIDNISFHHWSVFDNKTRYFKPDDEDRINICLFHGLVNNAVNDFGYQLTSDSMLASDFYGFDLVLLGDIHTRQYLNEEKTIAYPGSLIQQNHGEGLEHGILVWDVESKKSEFVPIKNTTCFLTIDIEDNEVLNWPETWYENTYLRIKYKNTSQEIVRQVAKEVKEKTNVIEFSSIKIKNVEAYNSRVNYSQGIDFRSIQHQNEYITKFLKSAYNLSNEELDQISELNNVTNSKLKQTEIPRNTIWTPILFEFENMFGYKGKNHINFRSMEGTYGIFAANASGKSTLLDAITFCLFDKCSKTSKAQEVMNNQSEDFKCKFSFYVNDKEHVIERHAKKQRQGNVRVEVQFYYINETGQKVSLNGKERSDTNANIRKLIGTYEDFILTSFSTQTGNVSFIDIGQRERKELLCQFMDLNVFEDLYLIANEELREILYLMKDLEKTDWSDLKSKNEKSLSDLEKDLQDNVESKKRNKKSIDSTQNKLNELLSKIKHIDGGLEGFEKQDALSQEVKLGIALSKIGDEISEKIENKNKLEKGLEELNKELTKYDILTIETAIKEIKSKNSSLQDIKLSLKKLETEYDGMLEKMKKLKDLKYDENCTFCMNNIFVKDAIQTKEGIKETEKKIEEIKADISNLESEIKGLEKVSEQKTEINKIERRINETKMAILKVENEIKTLENKKLDSSKLLQETIDKIKAYNKQEKIIKENKEVEEEISKEKEELKELKKTEDKINTDYTQIQVDINLVKKELVKCEEAIKKVNGYHKTSQLYKYYLESIHRDGIPHNLIAQTLPQIEDEINSILSQLVDFKVLLVTDSKNINGYIAYSKDRYWGIELVSGMEKFITSLAIRCALMSVSSLPRPNFLWIDEGFGTLDKQNLSSLYSLFDYLKTQFQFTVIISHIEGMRDMIDGIIEINKKDGVSKIQHS